VAGPHFARKFSISVLTETTNAAYIIVRILILHLANMSPTSKKYSGWGLSPPNLQPGIPLYYVIDTCYAGDEQLAIY